MRHTYNTINRLEKAADEIVLLNKNLVKKIPNSGIHYPPYLISKVNATELKIPRGWQIDGNRIVNASTLIYLEVKQEMS